MANNVTADWTLKVDYHVLKDQAQAVRTANSDLRDCFDRMKNLMTQTENFWKGEAAEAHRNGYNKNQTKIDEIIARYSEHVSDLEKIAQNYFDDSVKIIKQVDALTPSTF